MRNLAQTLEALEKQLQLVEARKQALREQIKLAKKKEIRENEEMRKESLPIFGELLLKSCGLEWNEIDYNALYQAISTEDFVRQIYRERRDRKTYLRDLRKFTRNAASPDFKENLVPTAEEPVDVDALEAERLAGQSADGSEYQGFSDGRSDDMTDGLMDELKTN